LYFGPISIGIHVQSLVFKAEQSPNPKKNLVCQARINRKLGPQGNEWRCLAQKVGFLPYLLMQARV